MNSILPIHGLPSSGFAAGLGAGRGFFAGLDTPMLIKKKPNPLRNESNTFIDSIPFRCSALAAAMSYFFFVS
ncbi:MAG: hypothetical protein ABSD44_14905, partial [Terracidiphilus sp.]